MDLIEGDGDNALDADNGLLEALLVSLTGHANDREHVRPRRPRRLPQTNFYDSRHFNSGEFFMIYAILILG